MIAGELGHRRQKIEAGHRHGAHTPGLHAGAEHNEGHADAAFIHVRFRAAERMVQPEPEVLAPRQTAAPAVVGEVKNIRVFKQPERADFFHEPADARIEIVGHRSKRREMVLLSRRECFCTLHRRRTVLDCEMHRVMGDLQVKRPRLLHLLLKKRTRAIGDTYDALGIHVEHVVPGIAAGAGSITREAVAHIIALIGRAHVVVAMIPFAEMRGAVARVRGLEHARNVQLLPVDGGPTLAVRLILMPRRRLRNLQTPPRGAAKRRGRVAAREDHPLGRESLDVGRAEIVARGLGVARNHALRRAHPALIVGEDDDEIGLG